MLPSHGKPFRGLHERVRQLIEHHDRHFDEVLAACREKPCSAADLLPVLFKRQMDAHQTGFAFAETVAHTNFMVARGDLTQSLDPDGVLRVRAT